LLQLYANIDETSMDEFHRMLYVFACLSDDCISTARAVKVFQGVVPTNNQAGATFVTDEEYNKVAGKTNN